jgi:hypothetical protein
MQDVVTTAIKAVNGGLFVVVFAIVGELAVPKRFSGLFSAAPSVALANLIVIVAAQGSAHAQVEATGMIIGAIAMVAVCALGIVVVCRYRARRGSLIICGAWLVIAELGYLVALR